jgi:uncharacterized protein YcbX
MSRRTIFAAIETEREYQDDKWGKTFDHRNTPNDWVAYISKYLGQAVTLPWNPVQFREQMLKVAALAVAVLEQDDYAPRHYDASHTVERLTDEGHSTVTVSRLLASL